jgi:glycerol-3-phosphate acyltransferase PlsX
LKTTVRIALDAMGGDKGPEVVLKGAYDYLRDHVGNGVKLYIVGKKDLLSGIWGSFKKTAGYPIEFVHAGEIVGMDEPISRGLKKKDSSLAVALRMHKLGDVDSVVSAGNTGVCMASGVRSLGRLEGVSRPAITGTFPTLKEKSVVVLDVGANVDSPPQNLYQFAVMGSIYASYINRLNRPTVGLLSIGEEKVKGNESTLQAYKILEKSSLNFIGNIEGNDILTGKCDVVVTDGFAGNIILKFGESIKTYLFTKMRRQVSSNLFSRAGAYLLAPFLKRLKNTFDPAKYGGAPLLGVNGVVIISHGSSNELAIKNAIRVAVRMVHEKVNEHISGKLAGHNIVENVKS